MAVDPLDGRTAFVNDRRLFREHCAHRGWPTDIRSGARAGEGLTYYAASARGRSDSRPAAPVHLALAEAPAPSASKARRPRRPAQAKRGAARVRLARIPLGDSLTIGPAADWDLARRTRFSARRGCGSASWILRGGRVQRTGPNAEARVLRERAAHPR